MSDEHNAGSVAGRPWTGRERPVFDGQLADEVIARLWPTCHHCGQPPEVDGDHSCPCPLTDSECLGHTLTPRGGPNA